MTVCHICFQPECPDSTGALARPQPGRFPSRLSPGTHEYRGYGEWAVAPDEAAFLLHRGYAVVNGTPQPVQFIHNEAYVTQLWVTGTNNTDTSETRFADAA